MRVAIVAASSLVVLFGCHTPESRRGESLPAEALAYTGTVVQGGTSAEPVTMLDQDGGADVRLTGSLQPELQNLAGGTVTVVGTWAPDHGGSLDVVRYELLRIDGTRPIVGILRSDGDGLWLDGEQSTRLPAAPVELHELVGARLWLIGVETDGGGLRLQSYGIIAEP